MNKKFITITFIFLLLAATVNAFAEPCCAAKVKYKSHAEIQKQRKKNKAKIQHLKWLENLETNKLYKNQQRLEDTSDDLTVSKEQYTQTQSKIMALQSKLSTSLAEFSEIDFQMRRRIRQIFKKQRSGFFELLLTSNDFNTFIDRIYFESIVIKSDYRRMAYARQKAKEIAQLKYSIEQQKRNLSHAIASIHTQQESIKGEIDKNQDMIQKLRTDRGTYERAEKDLARQSASLQAMISRRSSAPSTAMNINIVSGFVRPIGGRITSPFGWRVHPIFHSRSFHSGVDIAGPYRGGVRASNAGRVIYTGWYGGYGKVVILDHGRVNGAPVTTLYAHLNSTNVSSGQSVAKGQVVGCEGTTGYSTGPHVHFEVRVNGRPTNPLNYI